MTALWLLPYMATIPPFTLLRTAAQTPSGKHWSHYPWRHSKNV